MTSSERENIIFIIHAHSGISLNYLASLPDDKLEQLYKERFNG